MIALAEMNQQFLNQLYLQFQFLAEYFYHALQLWKQTKIIKINQNKYMGHLLKYEIILERTFI